MDDLFYIKDGSFCFIIPIFTQESKVCNSLFNKLQQIQNKKGTSPKDEIKQETNNAKEYFANHLRKNGFKNAQTHYTPHLCDHNYTGRFLCDCMASAIKFHDDVNQKNNATQFFLDNYTANYVNKQFSLKFNFNTLLYLIHEKDEKVAYLVIEIDLKQYNTNIKTCTQNCAIYKLCDMLLNYKTKHYIIPDLIIFIKHIFYKNKMNVFLSRNNYYNNINTNLQQWCIKYLKDICHAIDISYITGLPDFINDSVFRYSFIELKDLRTRNNNRIEIELNDTNEFLNKYTKITYGLLQSDEGWRNTPTSITRNKLQDYWSTRNFSCIFFLEHNALLYNLKNTPIGNKYNITSEQWYSRYQDYKYTNYIKSVPCLTGIDTLAIFPFLKAIYKEINIERYIKENSKLQKKLNNMDDARKELERLQKIINSTSFNLGEIACMEKCIYKQFGISNKISHMKELHSQQTDRIHFDYESKYNKKMYILTMITAVLTFATLKDLIIYMYKILKNTQIKNYTLYDTINYIIENIIDYIHLLWNNPLY